MIGNSYMRLASSMNRASASFTNNYSVLLDGVDEYVDLGVVSEVSNVSNFSISAWVKDIAGTNEPIFGNIQDASNHVLTTYLSSSDELWFQIKSGGTTATYKGATGLTYTGWHHIAVVFKGSLADNNKGRIYWDGVLTSGGLVGTAVSTIPSLSTSLHIGHNGTSAYYTGNVDEFAIFDYSLLATEVTDIYNSGVPTDLMTLAAAKRPEHYYRMGDGDTFSTLTDSGETGGNDGTMTNMESGDIVTDTP